eukprot:351297-Chlamydomonas_euryale.AAC.1
MPGSCADHVQLCAQSMRGFVHRSCAALCADHVRLCAQLMCPHLQLAKRAAKRADKLRHLVLSHACTLLEVRARTKDACSAGVGEYGGGTSARMRGG